MRSAALLKECDLLMDEGGRNELSAECEKLWDLTILSQGVGLPLSGDCARLSPELLLAAQGFARGLCMLLADGLP